MIENLKGKTTFEKIKWWTNFITTIIMNSIIVILILIGIIFLLYYVDVVKNSKTGKNYELEDPEGFDYLSKNQRKVSNEEELKKRVIFIIEVK